MGNFSFGDVDEIVCQHTLGEFRFFPKSNEDATVDFGGVRSNDDANQVTSNGQMMSQMNRVRWSWESSIAHEADGSTSVNLGKLSAHADLGTWTFTLLNGTIYKGTGRPVGDIQISTNDGTMTLKVAGGGTLEKL